VYSRTACAASTFAALVSSLSPPGARLRHWHAIRVNETCDDGQRVQLVGRLCGQLRVCLPGLGRKLGQVLAQ
jgi:hypothetical protein